MAYRKVTDTLYQYEKGRFGIKYDDGYILELELTAGDSTHRHPDVAHMQLKWYEDLENGKFDLNEPLWKILDYESYSDFREDVRNNTSTGNVLDYAKKKMPERWHKYLERNIRCW